MPTANAFRPRLDPLDRRDAPAFLTGAQVVVGSDAGAPPLVRVIDPGTQTEITQFFPFDSGFLGGVRVAVGDVTADGTPDLVAAAGPGGGPNIKVYDGVNGNVVSSFFAFPADFTGGVNVAVGDTNGDGAPEIIAGAGAGGGPSVGVFTATGAQLASFYAYAPDFTGGVRVASADVRGTGRDQIITTAGYTGGPDLRIFERDFTGAVAQVASFAAFEPAFRGGLYVTAGDYLGTGTAQIAVGAGPAGGPRVGVFSGTGTELASYYAYGDDFLGGVRVASADLTGDGADELLTVAGPTGTATVNIYENLDDDPTTSFLGFPNSQNTGFFVAGSGQSLTLPTTPAGTVAAAYDTFRANYSTGTNSVIVVPGYNYGGFGYSPFLFGGPFGYAPLYYDALGLYSPLGGFYGPSFFGFGGATALATATTTTTFFNDPFFNPGFGGPAFFDGGYYADPGYSYVDPGYYYDPGFVDYGGGFSDFGGGYYDGGGFSDFGGGFFF